MYHPDQHLNFPDSDEQEFIEIKNTGNKTVSLTGVYFSGTGFVYQFPAYSRNFSQLLKNTCRQFSSLYEKIWVFSFRQFTRNLSNKGENLVLADGFGNVIDSVRYSDQPPWPDADGNGYYLDLTDPLSDNSLAANWTVSTNIIVSVMKLKTA